MRTLLTLIGLIAVFMGLLWIGQGTGYVHWPASSFMINQMKWAYYGAGLGVAGLLLLMVSGRRSG
jgi:hypothetical protein